MVSNAKAVIVLDYDDDTLDVLDKINQALRVVGNEGGPSIQLVRLPKPKGSEHSGQMFLAVTVRDD